MNKALIALAIVGACVMTFSVMHFMHRDDLTAEQKLRIKCTQHAETDAAFERCMYDRRE